MSAENVAKYWSDIIFPNKSEESYSAYNPFAQARLFYVMQSIAKFLNFKFYCGAADFEIIGCN
jgi:hypothetical protein